MTVFYAQPYDLSATGFYFEYMEEYEAKRAKCRNSLGNPVEEFEIQFIDGDSIDAVLFEAIGVSQASIHHFMDKRQEWDDHEKYTLIIAVGEIGERFDIGEDDPHDFDIDIYYLDHMQDLAEHFVEEGFYGPIPEPLQFYIDYEAIARDLSVEYSEITVAGQNLVYRSL